MSYDENVNAASSSDVNIVNQKLQLEFLFEINFKLFFHDIYSASSPVLCISRLHQIISSQKPSLSHELFQFLNSKFWIIQTYISFMIFLHLTMNLVGISTHISIYVQPILVYNLVSVVMIYILILFYEKLNKSKELFFQIQSTNRVNNVMKSFLGSTGFTFKEDVRDGKNKKTFEYSTRSVDKTGMTTVAACNSTLPGNRTGHGHSWFKLPMSRSKSASTSQTKLLPSVDTTVPTDSNTHEKTGAIYSITKFLTGKRSKSFTSKSHLTPATLPSPHPPSSLFGQSRMPSTESHLPESDNGSVSSDDDDAHQVEIELDNDGNGGWKTLDFDASCNEVKKAITGPRGSVALRRGQPNDKNNSSQSTPTTPRGSSVLRSSSDPELNKLAKSMLQQQSIHRGSQPLVSADPPLSSKHRLYFPTTPFNSDAFFNYSPDMSEPARNMFRDRAHCHSFKLRGASYLQDSEKVDPGPPLFKLMLMELYEVEPKDGDRHDHVASRGVARKRVEELHQLPGCPFVFVVNFQIPGDPPVSLTNFFCVPPDVRERYAGDGVDQALALFEEFIRIPATEEERLRAWGISATSEDSGENDSNVSGTPHPSNPSGGGGGIWGMKMPSDVTMPDGSLPGELPLNDFRNVHFKMIPLVTEGPWVVKTAIPSKPVILGKKLAVRYFSGPGYFEVDVHVGSSSIAANVTGFARGYSKAFAADMGIVLQGETPEELPERLLALAHVHKVDVNIRRLLD